MPRCCKQTPSSPGYSIICTFFAIASANGFNEFRGATSSAVLTTASVGTDIPVDVLHGGAVGKSAAQSVSAGKAVEPFLERRARVATRRGGHPVAFLVRTVRLCRPRAAGVELQRQSLVLPAIAEPLLAGLHTVLSAARYGHPEIPMHRDAPQPSPC
jgi:hypothetical protein